MTEAKFFICSACGNLVELIDDNGVPLMCCGMDMDALEANTVEAGGEKHLPVVTVKDGEVQIDVGQTHHPMEDEHFIRWVYVQTENGGLRKALKPGDDPKVTFALGKDKPVCVWAYCNQHGLWKTTL